MTRSHTTSCRPGLGGLLFGALLLSLPGPGLAWDFWGTIVSDGLGLKKGADGVCRHLGATSDFCDPTKRVGREGGPDAARFEKDLAEAIRNNPTLVRDGQFESARTTLIERYKRAWDQRSVVDPTRSTQEAALAAARLRASCTTPRCTQDIEDRIKLRGSSILPGVPGRDATLASEAAPRADAGRFAAPGLVVRRSPADLGALMRGENPDANESLTPEELRRQIASLSQADRDLMVERCKPGSGYLACDPRTVEALRTVPVDSGVGRFAQPRLAETVVGRTEADAIALGNQRAGIQAVTAAAARPGTSVWDGLAGEDDSGRSSRIRDTLGDELLGQIGSRSREGTLVKDVEVTCTERAKGCAGNDPVGSGILQEKERLGLPDAPLYGDGGLVQAWKDATSLGGVEKDPRKIAGKSVPMPEREAWIAAVLANPKSAPVLKAWAEKEKAALEAAKKKAEPVVPGASPRAEGEPVESTGPVAEAGTVTGDDPKPVAGSTTVAGDPEPAASTGSEPIEMADVATGTSFG